MSERALSRLILDQRLRGLLGTNRCSHAASLWGFFRPSIHPWQSAVSRASAYVSDLIPDPFFAIRTQSSRALSWFLSSHAATSFCVLKPRMGPREARAFFFRFVVEGVIRFWSRVVRQLSAFQRGDPSSERQEIRGWPRRPPDSDSKSLPLLLPASLGASRRCRFSGAS